MGPCQGALIDPLYTGFRVLDWGLGLTKEEPRRGGRFIGHRTILHLHRTKSLCKHAKKDPRPEATCILSF